MKYLVPIFCLLLPVAAQADSDWLKGYWVVPAGDAILELKIEDEELKVTIAATLNPDHQDSQNPDKHQRQNSLVGLMLAHGFKLDDGEWQNGSIYDPGSGKTYRATLRQTGDNHLEVRGYIGFKALGRNQTWTRLAHYQDQWAAMLQRIADQEMGL